MQKSVIQIDIEFQKLRNRLLDKVKLNVPIVCTSWTALD